jgi:hypothetical protein
MMATLRPGFPLPGAAHPPPRRGRSIWIGSPILRPRRDDDDEGDDPRPRSDHRSPACSRAYNQAQVGMMHRRRGISLLAGSIPIQGRAHDAARAPRARGRRGNGKGERRTQTPMPGRRRPGRREHRTPTPPPPLRQAGSRPPGAGRPGRAARGSRPLPACRWPRTT